MGLSAPASSARSDAALAAGLFLAALLLQLAIFDRGAFYTDEGLVAQTAAEINRGRVPYRDIVMPLPGPAAFYLLAGVFRLTGESFTAARVTMAVMSSALAALLYLLARGAMARWAALLVGLAFLSCRLWAFPHWLFYHYASCAGFFTGLGYALASAALGRGSPLLAALAGTAAGVAFLAKQDPGGAGARRLGAAPLLLARERPCGRGRAGAVLLLIYAAASLAAFSPPRDWLHLLVLYHPTLLLGGVLLDLSASRLGTRARRALLGVATLAVTLGLLGALRITRDLRRTFATPLATVAGTVRLKRDEAAVLADLLAYV